MNTPPRPRMNSYLARRHPAVALERFQMKEYAMDERLTVVYLQAMQRSQLYRISVAESSGSVVSEYGVAGTIECVERIDGRSVHAQTSVSRTQCLGRFFFWSIPFQQSSLLCCSRCCSILSRYRSQKPSLRQHQGPQQYQGHIAQNGNARLCGLCRRFQSHCTGR